MKTNFKAFIQTSLFTVLFSIYPGLVLLSTNIREVDALVALRPLVFSLIGALGINLLLFRVINERIKASLITAVILLSFFSYGHIARYFINNVNSDYKNVIIVTVYIVSVAIPIAMAYIISKTARHNLIIWAKSLNTISIILIVLPLTQIFIVAFNSISVLNKVEDTPPDISSEINSSSQYPDIYYIILDAYNRSDTLEIIGYDNSEFLRSLDTLGFYIASCSRSNYRSTALSMPSALNMNYLWEAVPNTGSKDANVSPLYDSIIHSRVREELEQKGYKIISFQTGYQWDEWKDADLYLSPPESQILEKIISFQITPFEYLFLRNTALYPIMENSKFSAQRYHQNYDQIIFSLEELPNIASIPGPKFVYAHIMAPHHPFVFLPDGSLNPNINYYGAEDGYPSDPDLYIPGYLNGVQFLDSKLPGIIDTIIKRSETPPVIVIQSDHGDIVSERRYNILNAYYFPDQEYDILYPTISPVNTFRIIFNLHFNSQLDLLDDFQIDADIGLPYRQGKIKPFPETCPPSIEFEE